MMLTDDKENAMDTETVTDLFGPAKTEETEKKPKRAKAAKKPPKVKAKPNKAAKTAFRVKAPNELTDREKRLLAAFGGVGKKKTITELGDIAFTRERPAAKRQSWVRNNLRYLVASKMVKQVGRGTYERRS